MTTTMTNEWRVIPDEATGGYALLQPGREGPVLSCNAELAVTFHIDLLDPEVIREYSFWMSRVVTLTEAARLDQRIEAQRKAEDAAPNMGQGVWT